MKATVPQTQPIDPLAWANELRKREQRCERLTPAQRQMWRDALRQKQQTKEPA